MTNPYRGLPEYCFWSKAMADVAPWQVNPATRSTKILADEPVASMGSCFAQHLARHIARSGLNYFISEQPPEGMSAEEALQRNYGVFSARYGNVYNVRQALQLFERAFGTFTPKDIAWAKGKRFVDPFRPQIEPQGFESVEQLVQARKLHLECVRELFCNARWLVLTLGLTEAWCSKLDGAVFPLAPGVAGGSFDPAQHEFVNFGIDQVRQDLCTFIQRVRELTPQMKFLLTVSPVPLLASYEQRHVWVSTSYSKAVLRVAADEAERKFPDVFYFPSYEIITSPAAGGDYYADDLRQVRERGVEHVMRVFTHSFIHPVEWTRSGPQGESSVPALTGTGDVICDEEALRENAAFAIPADAVKIR